MAFIFKTNLGFFRRLRFMLLNTFKERGCRINIWAESKKSGKSLDKAFHTKKLKKWVLLTFEKSKFARRFNAIDIILIHYVQRQKPDASEAKPETAMASIVQEVKGMHHLGKLGEVHSKDLQQGKAIVNIEMDAIMQGVLKKKEGYDEPEFFDVFSRTLAHEVAHCWEMVSSKAITIMERNRKRISRMIVPETSLALRNKMIMESGDSSRFELDETKRYYEAIRKDIYVAKISLVSEGFARFIENYIKYPDFQERFEALKEDTKNASHMDSCYENLIKELKLGIKNLKEKGRTGLGMLSNIFFYDLKNMQILSYSLGMQIIGILFYDAGYTLEQLANMRPSRVLRTYEEFCISQRKTILVAVKNPRTKAVVNIRRYEIEINRLRKKIFKLLAEKRN